MSLQQDLARANAWTATAVRFLYANARPRFHTALYVLLWSAYFFGSLWIVLFAISLLPGFDTRINWQVSLAFIGSTAAAELVRGHMRCWLGESSLLAIVFAMVSSALTFSACLVAPLMLMWGTPALNDGLLLAGACVVGYATVLTMLRMALLKERKVDAIGT